MITTLLLLVAISVVNGKQQPSTMFTSEIDVSEQCRLAVQKMSALQTTEPQLMARYWDSWGKPSDALLTGHTTFLGYYDECTNLKDTVLGDMKYCLYAMAMNTNIIQSSSGSEDGVCDSSDCPTPMNVTSTFDVKIGVCYPSACSPNEFAIVLSNMNMSSITEMTTDPFSNVTNRVNIKLRVVGDSPAFCPVTDVELDASSKALIALCMVLVGLVIVGTLLDIVIWLLSSDELNLQTDKELDKETIKEDKVNTLSSPDKLVKDKKPNIKDFILAFSLYTTVPSLLIEQPPSAIKAVGSIKIFSNIFIIVLHVSFFLSFFFHSLSQNSYQLQLFTKISFQPIASITLAVESFFIVSATLSAYLMFKDMEKCKKFRLWYFYLNRFLRLSPLFYFYTLVAYKLSPLFGQGPLFFSQDAIACADSWWRNFLYITNFTPFVFDMCMPIAWHVAVDMQLVILSPVFIILLYHTWYLGLIAIGMAMVGATAMVGYVSATRGFWAAFFYNPNSQEQTLRLHIQTYYRVNSYMIGILLGYILYRKYSIAIPNWLKHATYALLWVIAIVLCSATMFAPYLEYGFIYHFTDFENVTYLMFSGLAWSIGVAIIIYICNTGYGGAVNSFLSWPGWDPLVKLSYGAALCNQMVIFFIFGSLQSGLKLSDLVFGMICLLAIVLSYVVSLMTALFVEQPISKVFSLAFKLAGTETRSK